MQMLLPPVLGFLFFGTIIGLIVGVITTIFWLWMLIDCITNAAITGTEKIVWLLVIIFTHILGAILYFVLARGGRASRPGI